VGAARAGVKAVRSTSPRQSTRTSQRPIEERVALAVPGPLLRLAFAAAARLPPGSDVRRRWLKRSAVRLLEASGRGALDFGVLAYEPDVELAVLGDLARTLGLAERYYGHQGVRDLWEGYRRDMDRLEFEPEQIIDLGECMALRVTLVGTGRTSGVTTRSTEGFVLYFSARGLISRHEIYWSWKDALAALDTRAAATSQP
jgi:ketosteroid isomerase-like protein